MIQNLILSIGLSFAIGLNGANDNHDNFINNETPNNVVYDDENLSITLSGNELNYTYTNLINILADNINNISFDTCNIQIDNDYDYILTYKGFYDNDSNYELRFTSSQDTDHELLLANYEGEGYSTPFVPYKFIYYNFDSETIDGNITELEFVFVSQFYDIFKNAIELDIQANTTQTSMGNSIINAIKSGLGLIGDLASQFLLGFSTLFWNSTNNTLTPFGTFALVMLGVAITMGVVSLVLNIIRNNTGA